MVIIVPPSPSYSHTVIWADGYRPDKLSSQVILDIERQDKIIGLPEDPLFASILLLTFPTEYDIHYLSPEKSRNLRYRWINQEFEKETDPNYRAFIFVKEVPDAAARDVEEVRRKKQTNIDEVSQRLVLLNFRLREASSYSNFPNFKKDVDYLLELIDMTYSSPEITLEGYFNRKGFHSRLLITVGDDDTKWREALGVLDEPSYNQ